MRALKTLFITAVILILANSNGLAQKTAKYVGVGRCQLCHRSNAKGNQFKVWQESRHSKAIETLGTPEAKAIADEMEIGDPQKAGECLQCHQTAHGVDADLIDKGFKPGLGVECESCHGPGSLFRVASVMSASKFKADPQGTLDTFIANGLIIPDEKTCIKCHNEKSPTFKGFDFEEYFAKIAHPNPQNPLKKK
ncbi:cytochrome C554 [candidate division KSB1 bacterium]|nr:cytochrome C554 [candidate division KSB1 bacterium]